MEPCRLRRRVPRAELADAPVDGGRVRRYALPLISAWRTFPHSNIHAGGNAPVCRAGPSPGRAPSCAERSTARSGGKRSRVRSAVPGAGCREPEDRGERGERGSRERGEG
ncbi:hypothetical protein SSP531S_17770 [Streptomyces spongiicola]|uniref:Uncharacterized protein n=1 Tax=Streptomyces spongiicola TaxID=1690221 RepID=A0A388SWW5_9ACTN|nr:hypothetical protein SSP531S_17770 [Streptomyces spongiicola]